MLHIDPFDRMTFGKIIRIQRFPSGDNTSRGKTSGDKPEIFILVYLKSEKSIKKIPANHGTWISIEEILRKEYLENETKLGWE